MKGSGLGEFQEIVLLSIIVLDENAYGVSIQDEIEKVTKRDVGRGALHTALQRLGEKGFITSIYGGVTAERGGRRKRFYQVTDYGKRALKEARSIRNELWSQVPELAFQNI